jgi:hypothetical protein
MITKFETGGGEASSTGSKGGNTLWIVLGLAVAGFLVYKFVIKPRQEQKEKEGK